MTEIESNIEVYQNLAFTLHLDSHHDVRTEIEKVALESGWHRVTDVEKHIEEGSAKGVTGVIVCDRDATPNSPSVQLAL